MKNTNKIYYAIVLFFFCFTLGLFAGIFPAIELNYEKNTKELVQANWNKPYTVDDTVYRLLRKYPGVDYELVKNIVACESGWRSDAKNNQSTASGYFQFIFNTWYSTISRLGWVNTTSPFDGERNLEAGIYLLSEGEISHWSSSYNCWR